MDLDLHDRSIRVSVLRLQSPSTETVRIPLPRPVLDDKKTLLQKLANPSGIVLEWILNSILNSLAVIMGALIGLILALVIIAPVIGTFWLAFKDNFTGSWGVLLYRSSFQDYIGLLIGWIGASMTPYLIFGLPIHFSLQFYRRADRPFAVRRFLRKKVDDENSPFFRRSTFIYTVDGGFLFNLIGQVLSFFGALIGFIVNVSAFFIFPCIGLTKFVSWVFGFFNGGLLQFGLGVLLFVFSIFLAFSFFVLWTHSFLKGSLVKQLVRDLFNGDTFSVALDDVCTDYWK